MTAADFRSERLAAGRFLRWSPVVGILFAGLLVLHGHSLVTLERPAGMSLAQQVLSVRFLMLALIPPVLALCWSWSLKSLAATDAVPRGGQVNGALRAVVLVVLLGWSYAQPMPQWYLLEAVKVRAEPFSLERSMAYWKASLRDAGPPHERAGVSVVGSSQVNLAVDEQLLESAMPGYRVWKNTLPGFGILQYLMIVPALELQNARLVVCMLSEFDAYRDDRLPAERLRYFGELPEKWSLITLLTPELVWANRSSLADLAMGSLSEFWRDRDLFRLLWQSAWWPAPTVDDGADTTAQAQERILAHANALSETIGPTALVDVNFAAFEAFAAELEKQGIDMLVLEGMTNPVATAKYDPGGVLREATRKRLSNMAHSNGFTYVSKDQMPSFSAGDFADAVHLNEAARKRFTAFLANEVCQGRCAGHGSSLVVGNE